MPVPSSSTGQSATFEEYLARTGHAYEVDQTNNAIDIETENQDGQPYTVTLVIARRSYTLFVSPLVHFGPRGDRAELYRRLLEFSDQNRYVKFSVDDDGDIKLSSEGFSRLDGFRQFQRRLEALETAIDRHGEEIAHLADSELF